MISTKVVAVLACIVCVTLAAPQYNPYRPAAYTGGSGYFVPITSQHYDLNPDGSYSFHYRSGDGSARDESGVVRGLGGAGEAMAVQGQYSYASPEGPVQVQYVADENGFQPSGSSVHPAIVQAVAQQVAEARANPYVGQGNYNSGFAAQRQYYPGQYRNY